MALSNVKKGQSYFFLPVQIDGGEIGVYPDGAGLVKRHRGKKSPNSLRRILFAGSDLVQILYSAF